ncbi:MAG: hypothetical protein DHS20C19_01530 [Acidimicrobiales bacterium]|nr:MAG: hypothetical protein DHS20C19_01530 [Acidimicrobiales bacterium]
MAGEFGGFAVAIDGECHTRRCSRQDSERESTLADTSQGDGWWVAADGKWYPPESAPAAPAAAAAPPAAPAVAQTATPAATQGNAGGLVSMIGWIVVIAGACVILATLVELSSDENQYLELNLADYLIALSPGFTVLGIGAAAAALGGILTRTR